MQFQEVEKLSKTHINEKDEKVIKTTNAGYFD